jgi:nucleotide-binding universal stress UspA family protein
MAKKFGARVTIVHVIPAYSRHAVGEIRAVGTQPLSKAEYLAAAEKRGKAALRRVEKLAGRAGVRTQSVLATAKRPGELLVATAREGKCDLIVMGSHSRTGIERIFIGSVANDVLKGTRTPVLICH